jgi:hypothetical protein
LLHAVLGPSLLCSLSRSIDRRYREIDRIRAVQGPWAVAATLGAGQRFSPTASSLTLSAVLAEIDRASLLRALVGDPVLELLENALGTRVVLDLDQAWVRRQYAPANYPQLHAPHGWHQDGALGFDFLALGSRSPPPDALIDMLTCWIALSPCGADAPGLEIVARGLQEILPIATLTDDVLRERYPPDAFERPLLAPGDALIFRGGTLHRTHVARSMREDRTSVELRFLRAGAIPQRLQHERFVSLDRP